MPPAAHTAADPQFAPVPVGCRSSFRNKRAKSTMETNPVDALVVATISPSSQLAVAIRGEGGLIRDPSTIGTLGRTLHQVYSALGSAAEKHANRAAHSLGMGPHAVTRQIQNFFGDGDERESKLLELGRTRFRDLEKDCVRLMKYALPWVLQQNSMECRSDSFLLAWNPRTHSYSLSRAW